MIQGLILSTNFLHTLRDVLFEFQMSGKIMKICKTFRFSWIRHDIDWGILKQNFSNSSRVELPSFRWLEFPGKLIYFCLFWILNWKCFFLFATGFLEGWEKWDFIEYFLTHWQTNDSYLNGFYLAFSEELSV